MKFLFYLEKNLSKELEEVLENKEVFKSKENTKKSYAGIECLKSFVDFYVEGINIYVFNNAKVAALTAVELEK